jgi:hypothetical protein
LWIRINDCRKIKSFQSLMADPAAPQAERAPLLIHHPLARKMHALNGEMKGKRAASNSGATSKIFHKRAEVDRLLMSADEADTRIGSLGRMASHGGICGSQL